MNINPEQISSVIALPGHKRYEYSIKRIVDWEKAWGLYQDGWALSSAEDNRIVFPIWPAREYADLCAIEEWAGYEARAFSLEDLMKELLPNLQEDNILPGIFPTPSSKGVTPPVKHLLADIYKELEKY